MKCGEVIVDKDGNVHRCEWETPEISAPEMLARFEAVFANPALMWQRPQTLEISEAAYKAFKRLGYGVQPGVGLGK